MHRDQRAIPTLGPFSWLLFETLWFPPKENQEIQRKNVSYEGKDWEGNAKQRITLYRGLGLPEAAIEVYREYKKKGDDLISKYGEIHKASKEEQNSATF